MDGLSCQKRLAALHFLAVACFNLQHPATLTPEGSASLQAAFCAHLGEGAPVAWLARRLSRRFAGRRRVRADAPGSPVRRGWPLTIADVYRPDNPEETAARVRQWAAAMRKALPPAGSLPAA